MRRHPPGNMAREAHPVKDWMPNIRGHQQKNFQPRDRGLINDLEERIEWIREEILGKKNKER